MAPSDGFGLVVCNTEPPALARGDELRRPAPLVAIPDVPDLDTVGGRVLTRGTVQSLTIPHQDRHDDHADPA